MALRQLLTRNTAEPSSTRLVVTLGIAGLLSGLAIVGIYELTLSTIADNKARELREAVFKVLPGVSRFQKLVYAEGTLQPATLQASGEEFIYAGYDANGAFVGYAIAGEGPGYQDTISLLYGYKPAQRRIVGMEVLDNRETPGSGDKIQKDPEFRENFRALAVEPKIIVVKKGTKPKPNQVDAITGATVSSNSVVSILENTNRRWLNRLPPAGTEPPLAAADKP